MKSATLKLALMIRAVGNNGQVIEQFSVQLEDNYVKQKHRDDCTFEQEMSALAVCIHRYGEALFLRPVFSLSHAVR